MARAAHPHAMTPSGRERTRTAPPRMPAQFPLAGRYRAYTLFGSTGLLYGLASLVALRVVWSLGSGPDAFAALQEQLRHPLYVLFHALCLAAVCFVGVRFFALFPKAQPPRIGPARPPPAPVILGMLYTAWAGVTAALAFALAGGLSQ